MLVGFVIVSPTRPYHFCTLMWGFLWQQKHFSEITIIFSLMGLRIEMCQIWIRDKSFDEHWTWWLIIRSQLIETYISFDSDVKIIGVKLSGCFQITPCFEKNCFYSHHMVNSHVILMRLTVMMLESIANKMRLVAYTDVRVLDELGVLLYPFISCFAVTLHAFWF